ncbi:MAG: D-glycero-beta-D-manno-heptose-7-phosphate kinase [Desulfonauticus sp.]|nr:D-glycero-beta-D-manno-heptose-7-phosphate kinase [Desulfonauticus sp.]
MYDKEFLLQEISKIKPVFLPIVGDVMLDHYSWGNVERISPEAPVPVVHILKDEYMLGGAGNVAKNIKKLGANPYLVGIIGNDEYGQQIKNLLKKEKINFLLQTSNTRPTTLKTRIICQNQQMIRLDREKIEHLSGQEINQLKNSLENLDGQFVIISDYGKGCICPEVLELIGQKNLIVDPKEKNYSFYKNFYLLTPNKKEAEQAAGIKITDQNSLIKAGQIILNKFKLRNLIITLGPEGMMIFLENEEIYHIPTFAQKVFDVTGAGDTVIATIALALASGLNLLTAAILANYAAGLVVAQLGTATTTLADLKRQIQNHCQLKLTKI